MDERHRKGFNRLLYASAAVALVLIVVCVLGAMSAPAAFYQSYLYSWFFWVGVSLGCLALGLLVQFQAGRWGVLIERPLENGALLLPIMGILFLPVALGIKELYVWSDAAWVANHPAVLKKSAYLNESFFHIRAAVYFVVWTVLAILLAAWSKSRDARSSEERKRGLTRVCIAGLIIYVLTVTFAAVDWIMSIEPDWYSTTFGFLVMTSQCLGALSFVVAVVLVAGRATSPGIFTEQRLRDLGNMLLMFVMLWAYIGFTQYLIIWMGNTSHDVPWFIHRRAGAWKYVSLFLIGCAFLLPFVLLLLRSVKHRPLALAGVAVLILATRVVDGYWLVMPSFHREGIEFHWLHVAVPLAIGAVWLTGFALLSARGPLFPRAAEGGSA